MLTDGGLKGDEEHERVPAPVLVGQGAAAEAAGGGAGQEAHLDEAEQRRVLADDVPLGLDGRAADGLVELERLAGQHRRRPVAERPLDRVRQRQAGHVGHLAGAARLRHPPPLVQRHPAFRQVRVRRRRAPEVPLHCLRKREMQTKIRERPV